MYELIMHFLYELIMHIQHFFQTNKNKMLQLINEPTKTGTCGAHV